MLNKVLDTIFYPSGGQTSSHVSQDSSYRNLIVTTITGYNYETLSSNQFTNMSLNAQALQVQLDNIMSNRALDNNVTYASKKATFAFTDSAEVKSVFDSTAGVYETQVTNRLADESPSVTAPYSQERIVLFSLEYGNILAGSNNLQNDISSGNRAEAWYEIRYNSNGGASASDGIAKRRYYESEKFGLYNDSSDVNEAEAKSVFKMHTKHRTDILEYDVTYGSQVARANTDYGTSEVK